jgi:Heterokaryon incompatibility protein (HET)
MTLYSTMADCYTLSLDLVANKRLDLSSVTVKRFRLIDCEAYINRKTLTIREWSPTSELNSIIEDGSPVVGGLRYATISYVWNSRMPSSPSESFDVVVDRPRDDTCISIDALRVVCEASLQVNLRYIWLDRVCIIQNNAEDKDFQLAIMGGIYRHSTSCFVLPGGLGKLAGLYDATTWIYRSWTLPEALLPTNIWCIFKWEYGGGNWEFPSAGESEKVLGEVYEIGTRKNFAMMPLWGALAASESRKIDTQADLEDPTEVVQFTPDESPNAISIPPPIFFSRETEPITSLLVAINRQGQNRRQFNDATQQAVWSCAIMRRATESLDEVKSLMGIFEVDVTNEAKTRTRDELMLTFCQKILAKPGGKPNWLAASVNGPWLDNFTTMPSPVSPPDPDDEVPFMETEQFKRMHGRAWRLQETPRGLLLDNGYLVLDTEESGIDIRKVERDLEADLDRPGSPFPGFSAVAEVRFHNNQQWELVSFTGHLEAHAFRVGHLADLEDIFFNDSDALGRPRPDSESASRTPVMWLSGESTANGWRRTGTIVAGLWPEISLRICRLARVPVCYNSSN